MRLNHPVTQNELTLPDDILIVSTTDLKGRLTFVNPAFVRVSGFTEPELIGKAHNIVRHPDMPEEAFADLWATLQAGRPWTGLVKNRCKNGDHYWVLANATPIREGNSVTGYMSVRTTATRAQVAAAEEAYRMFREKRAGRHAIRDGRVVRTSWASRYDVLARASVSGAQAIVTMLWMVPVLVGLWALLAPRSAAPARYLLAALLLASAGGAALVGLRRAQRLATTLRASAERVEELTQGRFAGIFVADGEDEVAVLQRALQALRTRIGF
ncbi:MAG: PAS domain-containing protein, partial [Proteobacteria bacterium]|nr:PAS domain-containing protein [Pseudomonadota bacterium]